jgi:hypothetical protein
MLEAKNGREGDGEPLLGQPRREAEIVWRVGEGDVVHPGVEPANEVQRVRAVNDCAVAGTKGPGVGSNGGETRRRDLDEIDDASAARQRLEAERTGAREEVEDASVGQIRVDDAQPGFANAVTRGTHACVARGNNSPSPPPAGDDAHAA